jgi:hypothetical protein
MDITQGVRDMKTGDMCVLSCGRKGHVLKVNPETVLVGVGEKHYFNYREQEFPRHQVRQFVPLKDEEKNEDLSKIVAFVEKVTDSLLPTTGGGFPLRPAVIRDGAIWGYYNSVSLEPAVVEVQSIARVTEVSGWTVTTWKQTSGSYWEPADVDDHTVGEFTNWKTAAAVFLKTIFDMRVDDEIQGLCDTEYAESLKEELS